MLFIVSYRSRDVEAACAVVGGLVIGHLLSLAHSHRTVVKRVLCGATSQRETCG